MKLAHASPPRRALLGAFAVASLSRRAHATPVWQPARPVRLVVPSAAGGAPDILSRILAGELAPRLGVPIVVENRPGGSGTIGIGEVVRAAPDGHTVGYGNVVTLAINRTLLSAQPYDVARDLAPVILMGHVQNALVVRPALPVHSVADLIALLRREPGRRSFASPGNGTTGHLGAELFRAMTGTDLLHVPYRGSPQALADLIAGQVDLMFDNLSSVLPHIREGRLRALGVSGARRTPLLPELPTIAEAGVPGYETTAWGGLVAPAATPPAALARLHAEAAAVLAMPSVRDRYADLAFEIAGGPREALRDLAEREAPRWAEVIQRSGARVD